MTLTQVAVSYKCYVDLGERIERARRRKGLTQGELGEAIGADQTTVSRIVSGRQGGQKYWPELARVLEVPFEWLTVGDNPPAWAADPPPQIGFSLQHKDSAAVLSLVGRVSAGDGDVDSRFIDEPSPFPIPDNWRVVQVEGMSAYPVVYPGQFVLVDMDRAVDAESLTEEKLVDLHDNLVLVQVRGNPAKAFLKRFCHTPNAPGKYVMASIDSGRSSPFIAPEDVLVIEPVVGTIYEDPRYPRRKRWHNKTVVVTIQP